jgi:hypothetical protein
MGHTPADKLKDIKDVLSEIRKWPGIKEKGVGIFYFKSIPFLHFHDKDGARWADVKTKTGWGKPIDLPFDASSIQRRRFLKESGVRYQALVKK